MGKLMAALAVDSCCRCWERVDVKRALAVKYFTTYSRFHRK